MPTTAFPSAWLMIAAQGEGNDRRPSSMYNPMNAAAPKRESAEAGPK